MMEDWTAYVADDAGKFGAFAAGVVLAGGRSRRMGASKAELRIGGEPLLCRIVSRIRRATPEVLVVGPPELGQLVPDVRVLSDLHPGLGPIAGIEAALSAISADAAFIVACDMPFINPRLISGMLKYAQDHPDADAIALERRPEPSVHRLEPLHAVYLRSCLPAIARHIWSGNYALFQLFTDLKVQQFPTAAARKLDPDGLSTLNANSPEEWAEVLTLAGSRLPPLDQTH